MSCPLYSVGQRSQVPAQIQGGKCLLSVGKVAKNVQPCLIHCSLLSAHKWFTFLPHESLTLCQVPQKFHSATASSSGLKSRILSSKSCPGCYGTTPLRFLEAFYLAEKTHCLKSFRSLNTGSYTCALAFICTLRPSFTALVLLWIWSFNLRPFLTLKETVLFTTPENSGLEICPLKST